MILTCPSCSTSYNVPVESIGIDGRQVRCKKCHHVWFQEGEKKALEDIINLIKNSDLDDEELVFGDAKRQATSAKPQAQKISIIQRLAVPLRKAKSAVFPEGNYSFLNYFSGVMVGMAAFSVVLFGLMSERVKIVSVIPSLQSVYEAIGFPISPYAHVNPEDSFIIERASVVDEAGNAKKLTASLINLTQLKVKAPALQVDYLDANGALIQSERQVLTIVSLNKEEAQQFEFPIPSTVYNDLASIQIKFTE